MSEIEKLIVSSRIRLARNLEGLPFKTKLKGAFDGIANTIKAKNHDFASVKVIDLSPDMSRALFEQHLISHDFLSNKINSIIVVKNDNRVVIMLGEEDHIRIQSIQVGLNLQIAYEAAKKIADDIETGHEIAKRDDFGYLTSCPTNLGTGMRASVMMFLPALTLTNQIGNTVKQYQHITVRGVYGEGSTAGGFMYQISNQSCFGMQPEEVIRRVTAVAIRLAKDELAMQARMHKDAPDALTDRVYRSWGILTNALMLSSAESVEHLAILKLGACLGIIVFKNVRILDDLFFITQPNTLVTVDERASSIITRDKIRATRVSEVLRASRIK